jgi:hypothetical protein
MKVPRDAKTRGEWVELLFMARAAREGLKVSRPHGDARYDVIIESPSGLYRVQVKSTLFKRRGCYECLCFWSRVGKKRVAKPYRRGEVDFIAAYVVAEDAWFIIPVGELRGMSLYLPPKERVGRSRYGRFHEAWGLLGADGKGLTIQACADVLAELEELARGEIAKE